MTTKNLWITFSHYLGSTVLHPQYIAFKWRQEIIDYSKKYSKGKLIDIGCGRMEFKEYLEGYITSYAGLETPKMQHIYKTEEKPDIFGDVEKLPLKNNEYDTVLFVQVLEYVSDPNKSLSEIARVLKSGGIAVISAPFMYPIHDAPYDRNRYTKTAIEGFIKGSGLKVVKKVEQGTFLDFYLQMLLLYIFKRIKELIHEKEWYTKIFLVLFIILGIILTIPFNVVSLILDALIGVLPKYENSFPMNYLYIVKK